MRRCREEQLFGERVGGCSPSIKLERPGSFQKERGTHSLAECVEGPEISASMVSSRTLHSDSVSSESTNRFSADPASRRFPFRSGERHSARDCARARARFGVGTCGHHCATTHDVPAEAALARGDEKAADEAHGHFLRMLEPAVSEMKAQQLSSRSCSQSETGLMILRG